MRHSQEGSVSACRSRSLTCPLQLFKIHSVMHETCSIEGIAHRLVSRRTHPATVARYGALRPSFVFSRHQPSPLTRSLANAQEIRHLGRIRRSDMSLDQHLRRLFDSLVITSGCHLNTAERYSQCSMVRYCYLQLSRNNLPQLQQLSSSPLSRCNAKVYQLLPSLDTVLASSGHYAWPRPQPPRLTSCR